MHIFRTRNVLLVVLLLFIACGIILYLKSGPLQIVTLPDGFQLALVDAKIGRTNTFIHGNAFEKVLGPVLPAQPISIGKFSLKRPQEFTMHSPWE